MYLMDTPRRSFRFAEVGLLGEGGGKFGVRNIGQEMGNAVLNEMGGWEFVGVMLAMKFELRCGQLAGLFKFDTKHLNQSTC